MNHSILLSGDLASVKQGARLLRKGPAAMPGRKPEHTIEQLALDSLFFDKPIATSHDPVLKGGFEPRKSGLSIQFLTQSAKVHTKLCKAISQEVEGLTVDYQFYCVEESFCGGQACGPGANDAFFQSCKQRLADCIEAYIVSHYMSFGFGVPLMSRCRTAISSKALQNQDSHSAHEALFYTRSVSVFAPNTKRLRMNLEFDASAAILKGLSDFGCFGHSGVSWNDPDQIRPLQSTLPEIVGDNIALIFESIIPTEFAVRYFSAKRRRPWEKQSAAQ